MKETVTRCAIHANILLFTLLTAFLAILPCAPVFAAQEGILFEKRQITDPQFGGAVAATVNVPQGWTLEGKVDWPFQTIVKPAYVGFSVKSPADDAEFGFVGPFVSAFHFSQSPNAANEARYLGCSFMPPTKSEDLIKRILEIDKSISGLKVARVDKLAGNAENREKLRKEVLARTAQGITDFQIDEALTYVTFTRNGVSWEGMFYMSARYTFGISNGLPYCGWNAGPLIGVQAHAGKLKDYEKVLAAICNGWTIDPVWVQATDAIGIKLVQQRLLAANEAALAARRAAQSTYAQAEINRSTLNRQSESSSRVMRGWTDTLAGTDRWQGGSETHAAPSGYNYGWSGPNGRTFYSNDSTFNPNTSSSFSGDWSQMKKTPW